MENSRLVYLFELKKAGKASSAEKEELKVLLSDLDNHKLAQELIGQAWLDFKPGKPVFSPTESDLILQRVLSYKKQPAFYKIIPYWMRYTTAAMLFLCLTFGGYFYFNKQKISNLAPDHLSAKHQNDIKPGSDKAIFIDVTGKSRDLEGVVFTAKNNAGTKAVGTNTIMTPKGGQFQVVLPDGTHVWLNAASSLKFPSSFSGTERSVDLIGEAYFEVAHNKEKPFKVKTENQEVQVLGTHFNVNAYPDEAGINTTLLEGAVKIISDKGATLIKPGQYLLLSRADQTIRVGNADIETVVAWKNGFFQFDKADLKTVLRQISRWYNIEVQYEGKIPDRLFSGKIYRTAGIQEVLDILSYKKIHYRFEHQKIIITK